MIPIRTNTQLMQFLSVLYLSWCLPLCSKYYADTLLPVIYILRKCNYLLIVSSASSTLWHFVSIQELLTE